MAAALGSALGEFMDPGKFDAAVFDLDGVVTRSETLHFAAWKRAFDAFLSRRRESGGENAEPFAIDDYRRYVDGKPRYEGVQSFLAARGIDLPPGDPADPPEAGTVCGLGNRKNALFRQMLESGEVQVIEPTVAFIRSLRERGIPVALVSSSRNARAVLASAGIADLFDAIIDGEDAARGGLRGKPCPDTFREAARRLGVDPARALLVEDAISGVQAGRDAGFGAVVGLAADEEAGALLDNGADTVVSSLAELASPAQRPGRGR